MSLAKKPCYPQEEKYMMVNGYSEGTRKHKGLTFRESLILALASNPGHITEKQYDYADNLVKQADLIIDKLEGKKS